MSLLQSLHRFLDMETQTHLLDLILKGNDKDVVILPEHALLVLQLLSPISSKVMFNPIIEQGGIAKCKNLPLSALDLSYEGEFYAADHVESSLSNYSIHHEAFAKLITF